MDQDSVQGAVIVEAAKQIVRSTSPRFDLRAVLPRVGGFSVFLS